jgi:riboflavin synthase
MFTGIIETLGTITALQKEGSNVHFTIQSSISTSLKIDQSVSHNGACLTVVAIEGDTHIVTAIDETLQRTNLGAWKVGSEVNLERAMLAGARLDGHLVQGHVDATGNCLSVEDRNGSWLYTFEYALNPEHLVVDKGSVCVNGVSLTVVNPSQNTFSVAIIPYTYEHTTFHNIQVGDTINLEFDIIGKYIARHLAAYRS